MTAFAIYSPAGELLASYAAVEEATYAGRTRWAGRVGWIERTSDRALIGAPGNLPRLRAVGSRAVKAMTVEALPGPVSPPPPAPVPEEAAAEEVKPVLKQAPARRAPQPGPVEEPAPAPPPAPPPPPAPEEPPTDEARVLASLSADTWRTRAEVAQLAGLEEDLVGWVLLRLLDAGRVRWARAVWSLPP